MLYPRETTCKCKTNMHLCKVAPVVKSPKPLSVSSEQYTVHKKKAKITPIKLYFNYNESLSNRYQEATEADVFTTVDVKIKRRIFTDSHIFLENCSKLSDQAFRKKNVLLPSWFYKFLQNACGQTAFLLNFACLLRTKFVKYKKQQHGKCNMVSYTTTRIFLFVSRDCT